MSKTAIRGIGDPVLWDVAEGEPETPPGNLEEVMKGKRPEEIHPESRWPFIHDRNTGQTYVGGQGWGHWDLYDKLNFLKNRPDIEYPFGVESFPAAPSLLLGVVAPNAPIEYYPRENQPNENERRTIEPNVVRHIRRKYQPAEYDTQQWDFHPQEDWTFEGKGTGGEQLQWDLGDPRPLPFQVEDLTESPEAANEEYGDYTHGNTTPFYYSPIKKKLWIGGPGWFHWNIYNAADDLPMKDRMGAPPGPEEGMYGGRIYPPESYEGEHSPSYVEWYDTPKRGLRGVDLHDVENMLYKHIGQNPPESWAFEGAVQNFGIPETQTVGNMLGVDWDKVDINQLRRGIAVEAEHAGTVGDPTVWAQIALDHLNELPDYYTKLDAMEKRGADQLQLNLNDAPEIVQVGGGNRSHGDGRAFIYVPGRNKIYIGDPGSYHMDLRDENGDFLTSKGLGGRADEENVVFYNDPMVSGVGTWTEEQKAMARNALRGSGLGVTQDWESGWDVYGDRFEYEFLGAANG